MKPFGNFLSDRGDDFSRAYGESNWLLMTDAIKNPLELLNWDDLSDLVSTLDIPGRELAFVKNEDYFNPIFPLEAHRGSAPSARENKSNVPEIFSQMIASGYTLIVNKAYKHHSPIGAFCRGLSNLTRADVHANIYASWGPASPFPAHWDEHDVLVLQIEGRKRWWIYGSNDINPVNHQQAKQPCPDSVLWEGELKAGDALYIPRGCYHKASADAEPSLHVTVGIYRLTALDIVQWLASEAAGMVRLRRNVPHMSDKNRLLRFIEESIDELTKVERDAYSFERYALNKITNRPHVSLRSLMSRATSKDGVLERLFVINPFFSYEPSTLADSDFVVYVGAKKLAAPAALAGALNSLRNGDALPGRRICDALMDHGVAEDEATEIFTDLIFEGVIHEQ